MNACLINHANTKRSKTKLLLKGSDSSFNDLEQQGEQEANRYHQDYANGERKKNDICKRNAVNLIKSINNKASENTSEGLSEPKNANNEVISSRPRN